MVRDPEAVHSAHPIGLALAVADVNWFSTENLFAELDVPSTALLALRCMDFRNGWRQGLLPWSRSCRPRKWTSERSWKQDLILPSGWMKRYPRLGMRPIAGAVRRFWRAMGPAARRVLVATYPHYHYLWDSVEPQGGLYYALDDYRLYWPRHAEAIQELERRLVHRATATVCVARRRCDELRKLVPQAAAKIHHIPHGTPAPFLASEPLHRPAAPPPDLAVLPRPLLGYVGSISDRLDWEVLNRLALAFPQASIVLVGRLPRLTNSHGWEAAAARLLSRPNVHAVGWRSQLELPGCFAAFDAILIPYDQNHPFNQSCSPTKIMDGLGSGRPIVATAIPECRLYEHLFEVAATPEAFLEAVTRLMDRGFDDGKAAHRHAHAAANRCSLIALRLLRILDRPPEQASPGSSPILPDGGSLRREPYGV